MIYFTQLYYFLFHSPLHADPVRAAAAYAAVAVAPAAAAHTSQAHGAYVLMKVQVMNQMLDLHHLLKQNHTIKRSIHTHTVLDHNPVLTLDSIITDLPNSLIAFGLYCIRLFAEPSSIVLS